MLINSVDDANTYLVADASDPLQRSLMDLELKDALLASATPPAYGAGEPYHGVKWIAHHTPRASNLSCATGTSEGVRCHLSVCAAV